MMGWNYGGLRRYNVFQFIQGSETQIDAQSPLRLVARRTAVYQVFLVAIFLISLAPFEPGEGIGFARLQGQLATASATHPEATPTNGITPTLTLTPTLTFTPTLTLTPTPTSLRYLPLVMNPRPPKLELLDAWTSDVTPDRQLAFLPNSAIHYHSRGINNLETPVQAGLRWTQSGSCGVNLVFSDTLTLAPGEWEHFAANNTPECTGIFTTTVQVSYKTFSPTLTTRFAVNPASAIQVNQGQGFDRCRLPTVGEMQTWWDESPYSVFNLYLGGVSYACKDEPLDALWVHQVARQGWSFILTWVGPQAPCTSFRNRMSPDPAISYWQGWIEASDAALAATRLGFLDEKIIYYDVEAYSSAPSECRAAVRSFMLGWVEGLHELSAKAGGYGGACSSYISEWATNDPPPDDVWIAHWYRSEYDPDATVWDAPCVSNSLWANQRRLKQYTGGHRETWGGVALTIDSNVLDGEITLLPGLAAAPGQPGVVTVEVFGPQLREAGLLSPVEGWLLEGERLYRTEDGGVTWQEITPAPLIEGRILGVDFRDPLQGWVVSRAPSQAGLVIARTLDSGSHWWVGSLPLAAQDEVYAVEAAFITPLDERIAWVALKLQSGSSFSLGRLFLTQDGGNSWEERSIPLGGRIVFLDEQRGWTAGGAADDLLYNTLDGGRTWQSQALAMPAGEHLSFGLPWFTGESTGWLPVVLSDDSGTQLALLESRDEGNTWNHPAGIKPDSNATLRRFVTSDLELSGFQHPAPLFSSLPEGIFYLDFTDELHGWALAQENTCRGSKQPASPDEQPLSCTMHWKLLATADGGESWRELSLGTEQP